MKKISLHPKMRLALSQSYRYLKNWPSTDSFETTNRQTIQKLFLHPTNFGEEIIAKLRKTNNNNPTQTATLPTKKSEQSTKDDVLERIHRDIASCNQCFLGKSRGNHLALPSQKKPAQTKVFVIVDNVSYYDQIREQYFFDEAGSMIKRILGALEIPMSSVYATSAIKCTQAVEFGDRISETKPCLAHLYQEISHLEPELIIAFGEVSYQMLKEEMNEKSDDFEAIRGKVMPFLGKKIIFTYHPRKIMRNPSLKKEVWENLKHLSKVAR